MVFQNGTVMHTTYAAIHECFFLSSYSLSPSLYFPYSSHPPASLHISYSVCVHNAPPPLTHQTFPFWSAPKLHLFLPLLHFPNVLFSVSQFLSLLYSLLRPDPHSCVQYSNWFKYGLMMFQWATEWLWRGEQEIHTKISWETVENCHCAHGPRYFDCLSLISLYKEAAIAQWVY